MKTLLLLCSMLLILHLGCNDSTTPDNNTNTNTPKKGAVKGVIRNALNSTFVSSALVTTEPTTEEVLTDSNGSYIISGDSGSYQLSVTKVGYLPYSKTITIRANDTTRLDILLYTTASNSPPSTPQLTTPTQSAVLRKTTGFTFAWTCTDSDGDALSYDVFFGEINQMKRIGSNISTVTHPVPTLKNKTNYQWQILARDSKGSVTKSAVGSFSVDSINTGGVNSDGLVAFYPLDGTAEDKSGNNLHGSADAITYTTGVDGKANGCAVFDGKGSIEIQPDPLLNLDTSFAISMWAYPEKYGDNLYWEGRMLICKYSGGSSDTNSSFYLSLPPDSTVIFALSYSMYAQIYKSVQPKKFQLNTWSHICIVRNNLGTLKIYINGILSALYATSLVPKKSTTRLTLGRYSNYNLASNNFYGKLDNIRMYNRTLTEDEVKNLYNAKQ